MQSKLAEGDASEEELEAAIASSNYMRAVMLSEQLQHPRDSIRRLQAQAIRKMACAYRNAVAARKLAREWEFSKAELEAALDVSSEESDGKPDRARPKRRCDPATGEYLTLPQWMARFLSTWHKG